MGSSYYTDKIWFVLYLISNKHLSLFPTAQQLRPWPVTTSFKFWLSSREKEFAKKEKHSSTFKLKIVLSSRQYALSQSLANVLQTTYKRYSEKYTIDPSFRYWFSWKRCKLAKADTKRQKRQTIWYKRKWGLICYTLWGSKK